MSAQAYRARRFPEADAPEHIAETAAGAVEAGLAGFSIGARAAREAFPGLQSAEAT